MKRILALLFVLMMLLTSCASTWYTVKSVTGTAPLNDNLQTNCALAESLVFVGPAQSVTVRCEWWQTSVLLKADSLVIARGSAFTFNPPSTVPLSSVVTATVRARDGGGTSCPYSITLTPTATNVAPARPTLSIVP